MEIHVKMSLVSICSHFHVFNFDFITYRILHTAVWSRIEQSLSSYFGSPATAPPFRYVVQPKEQSY